MLLNLEFYQDENTKYAQKSKFPETTFHLAPKYFTRLAIKLCSQVTTKPVFLWV